MTTNVSRLLTLSDPFFIHDLSHKRYKQGAGRLALLASENVLYIY